jgi:hypothetical protein
MSSWNPNKLSNREVRAILKVAQAKGCKAELRNGGHIKITAPSGEFFFMSQTPSDIRALARVKSDFKRIGIKI